MVKEVSKKSSSKKVAKASPVINKVSATMQIASEREIARDFALKAYKEFDQMIKSIILFGSSAKNESGPDSDIDIVIIIDDASVNWDQELIAWYREELGKLVRRNPYVRPLHINTIKLTTWWKDMMRGDPVIINVLRYGEELIDFGGFFTPLRILLKEGKIKATPESIYTLLEGSRQHLTRARQSMLATVDALYWSMVDSAHAVLIASDIQPASPEEIADILMKEFVKKKKLHKKYVYYYDEIHGISKEIIHGHLSSVQGKDVDEWFKNTEEFVAEMAKLVKEIVEEKSRES